MTDKRILKDVLDTKQRRIGTMILTGHDFESMKVSMIERNGGDSAPVRLGVQSASIVCEDPRLSSLFDDHNTTKQNAHKLVGFKKKDLPLVFWHLDKNARDRLLTALRWKLDPEKGGLEWITDVDHERDKLSELIDG